MFCGDDEGDLWMYNVKRFMQDKITDIEKMYAPSRVCNMFARYFYVLWLNNYYISLTTIGY